MTACGHQEVGAWRISVKVYYTWYASTIDDGSSTGRKAAVGVSSNVVDVGTAPQKDHAKDARLMTIYIAPQTTIFCVSFVHEIKHKITALRSVPLDFSSKHIYYIQQTYRRSNCSHARTTISHGIRRPTRIAKIVGKRVGSLVRRPKINVRPQNPRHPLPRDRFM